MILDPNEKLKWVEVGYTLSPKINRGGNIVAVAGLVAGMRSDAVRFHAMYDMPWLYPANFDWTVQAKKRLDSFLDCACSQLTGMCAFHKGLIPEWGKQDELRNNIKKEEIPMVLRTHMGLPEEDPANKSRIILPH